GRGYLFASHPSESTTLRFHAFQRGRAVCNPAGAIFRALCETWDSTTILRLVISSEAAADLSLCHSEDHAFVGRGTYELAGSAGVASGMHRSFVGSSPRSGELRRLRMTMGHPRLKVRAPLWSTFGRKTQVPPLRLLRCAPVWMTGFLRCGPSGAKARIIVWS